MRGINQPTIGFNHAGMRRSGKPPAARCTLAMKPRTAASRLAENEPDFANPDSPSGRRIGPRLVPLRAGVTGFWVQATGRGEIDVTVSSERLGTAGLTLAAG